MGYPGSKGGNGTWQQIISQIPKCDLFIEVMAGSGILSKKLKGYPCSTVTNDLDISLKTDLHLSYQDLLVKYDCNGHGKVVMYFDPPYLLETRKSKRRIYTHQWTNDDHKKFLSRVLKVKCNCMISHYPHAMYKQALKSWRTVIFRSMTHGGVREEQLWMNFKTPAILLAADTVGIDCWDRQGVKRKIQRLLNKLKGLRPIERAAIYTQLKNEFEPEYQRASKKRTDTTR